MSSASLMYKIFAVIYALVMLMLTVVQVWLCVVSLPFILVALFTIPWGWFFALCALGSAFDTNNLEGNQP